MTVINNYQTWLALLRAENVQQNGQIPPSVFNTWYNEVNDWYFKGLAEEFQTHQVMSDLLSPFRVEKNVLCGVMPGRNWCLAAYPDNYEYYLNAAILRPRDEEKCCLKEGCDIVDLSGKSKKYTDPEYAKMTVLNAGANIEERQIQLIDTGRWDDCLNHYSKKPTWNDPKLTQFNAGFKVAPKGLASILLSYLKTPRKSVFAYTVSDQDILIYDDSASTQLEWSDQVLPIFLIELQKKYDAYIGRGREA